ncbi:hypothetical protein LSH36_556g00051 [Paralvinella palmiformis]|uniref:Uncharacterized protein n=1 Tax=Paralvinella palmiformis TaxID=53620 RepID=A0AAD9MY81_9ANNE|nr:hypothetical protein LSH36_556g00051 [Paralvinella palmiformis]
MNAPLLDYQGHVSTFQNTMKKKDPGEGYTGQITVPFKAYLELASHSSVKTICETGFFTVNILSIVILDNYPQKSWRFNQILGDVWEWTKRNGEISEIFRCHVDAKPSDFGFSVGKYLTRCM